MWLIQQRVDIIFLKLIAQKRWKTSEILNTMVRVFIHMEPITVVG